MKSVKITIEYIGEYKNTTGVKFETLYVDDEIRNASQYVSSFLDTNYGIETPYTMMIRGIPLARAIKEDITVKEGDSFMIIPFLSGG